MSRPTGDRRMVVYPPHPGARDAGQAGPARTVAVVGAGIAGLTAATALAERGVRVTVYERHEYLGGRVGGWPTRLPDGTPVTMSRGFHAFFRQYYNLRALLRRTDPGLERLRPLADYPVRNGQGLTDTFADLPRTPPLNALWFALRSPSFGPRDLLRLRPRAALPLLRVSVPGIYDELDQTDAATFLRRINFPDAARHLAFEVFSRSFFAEPDSLSAAELATMFHLYFLGSSEGLVFDVASEPFPDALWSPLRCYLEGLDVRFRAATAVRALHRPCRGGIVVHPVAGPPQRADAVVLATDLTGLREIVAASPSLGTPGWRARIARLRTAPPFLVRRLWLDRAVDPSRSAFLGTGATPPLDNISVLERFEGEAARYHRSTEGSVVELHAYASTGDPAQAAHRSLARLHELYPETRDAGVRGDVRLWRQDCPLMGVGDFAERPGVATPHPELVLAGDGIRIDLPTALMERAATTGWAAANRVLAFWGLAGHPLRSVPNRPRWAPWRGRVGQRGRSPASTRRA